MKYNIKNPEKLKGVWGRPAEYFLESDIREAMAQTLSNSQASKYLGVSYPTYRKYAKMYNDEKTGKTLFEMHKSTGKGIKRFVSRNHVAQVEKVLSGEMPPPKTYRNRMKFIKNLLRTMMFEEKCSICGWNDKRPVDMTVPLLLEFKDGNMLNYSKDNLQLICPNCYSIYIGDVYHSRGYRKEYQGSKKKKLKIDNINYENIDLDKPLTKEELDKIDLSKL